MGVMLTFKSKSYCSSCLRGAVMGVSPGSASPCTVVLQGVASMGRDRDRDGVAAGGRLVSQAFSSS